MIVHRTSIPADTNTKIRTDRTDHKPNDRCHSKGWGASVPPGPGGGEPRAEGQLQGGQGGRHHRLHLPPEPRRRELPWGQQRSRPRPSNPSRPGLGQHRDTTASGAQCTAAAYPPPGEQSPDKSVRTEVGVESDFLGVFFMSWNSGVD